MNVLFDEKALNNIFNNNELTVELCECIGAVIDAELEKNDDEIDFEFVDECSSMLLDIQNGEIDYARLLPVLNSDSFIKKTKHLAENGIIKFAKIGLAAAIIMASALTANAAVGSITGKTIVEHIIEKPKAPVTRQSQERVIPKQEIFVEDEIAAAEPFEAESETEKTEVVYQAKTEKQSVVYEEQTAQPTSEKTEKTEKTEHPTKKEETTVSLPVVTGLDAVIIHSVFKTEYFVGEEFDTSGLYLVANYSDGTRKTLDTSECTVSGFDSSSPSLCRVCISYENSMYYIDITVKEKDTATHQDETENEKDF